MSMSVVMGAGALSLSDLQDFLAKEVLKLTGQAAKELEVVLAQVNVGKLKNNSLKKVSPTPEKRQ